MGRFKWLEVDKDKNGGEESAEKKLEAAGEKASKKIAEIQTGAETVQKNHVGVTKFGKTSESDGVIYDSDYFKNEGLKNYETCEYEQALYNFSKCLSENNKDEEAWLYQILTQIHLDKYSDALIWAKKAYEYFSSSSEAQAMLALALALNGETESAMAYSDGAVAKNRPGFFLWFARGEALVNMQNFNNAFICFKKCAEFKKMSGAKCLDYEIAMALFRAKCYARALPYFKKALQAGMSNFFVFEKIAHINEKLEFFDEAQLYYRQSINLKSSNIAAIEGERRSKAQNGFFIKLFNGIYKFFKLGGRKNE